MGYSVTGLNHPFSRSQLPYQRIPCRAVGVLLFWFLVLLWLAVRCWRWCIFIGHQERRVLLPLYNRPCSYRREANTYFRVLKHHWYFFLSPSPRPLLRFGLPLSHWERGRGEGKISSVLRWRTLILVILHLDTWRIMRCLSQCKLAEYLLSWKICERDYTWLNRIKLGVGGCE